VALPNTETRKRSNPVHTVGRVYRNLACEGTGDRTRGWKPSPSCCLRGCCSSLPPPRPSRCQTERALGGALSRAGALGATPPGASPRMVLMCSKVSVADPKKTAPLSSRVRIRQRWSRIFRWCSRLSKQSPSCVARTKGGLRYQGHKNSLRRAHRPPTAVALTPQAVPWASTAFLHGQTPAIKVIMALT
jgi:hypothetical protein